MKKLTTMILMGAVITAAVSCKKGVVGEGPAITQVRAITGFTAIDLRMAGDVYYTNAPVPKLEIIAQQKSTQYAGNLRVG